MNKKLLFSFMVVALALSTVVSTNVFAATSYIGSVVKLAGGDTLYYVASDGKRYVYPNENIYKSWFTNFNDVVTISAEELAAIPLGGSIQYRPGVILIKVQTDPKVYAVSENGTLRWVKTETLARQLYGDDWANLVDDLQASFFASYHIGDDVDKNSDYDADQEVSDNDSFEHSHGLAIGHSIRHGDTVRCRVLNRVLDKLTERDAGHSSEAISRVLERKCERDDDDDGDNSDKVAPTISGIAASAATSTATITWTTNEAANSKVKYADESLATASTTDTVSNPTFVTSHSLQLSGLTPSTTYYFMVESKDSSGNKATSTQQMFTTSLVPVPDTIAPVISSIVASAATSTATITWTTNEAATSKLVYDNESLATSTTTSSLSNASLVTSHSLGLLGLTPSTTYYFIVESMDASSNSATSSQQTFLTLVL